ncbi:ribosome biogenesis protein bop1-A-like [Centruroides sculpturatus]|uniref:ribosome biogenesis protein bop1-A-like n=1 Tax=Centruroides sculpturatus TaxID=218467 RepID=UPI000C6EE70B|nr:ribosome biogenesis protein bop1-A-like [Centruroides sculpturatus]XP_023241897.1 ribosome biogenesis protein bop1-A-like [Centruroides sculpturatus]
MADVKEKKRDLFKLNDSDGDSYESSEYEEEEDSSSDASSDSDDLGNGDNKSVTNTKEKPLVDEYAIDSSDEEDIRNTIGNIPIEWYDDYPHIGYSLDGKKILKPLKSDELEDFIKKVEDPNYWRTVKDEMTGQNVILSDGDIEIIQRIQKGKFPDVTFQPYEPFEDFFTYKTMIHPVTNRPEDKRSFIPSEIERKKVSRMVHAIKMGWIKPRKKRDDTPKFYMLWKNDENVDITKRMQHYIPAPKMKLPGHEESYNPPPEYLFTKEEEEKWKDQEPEERKINFVPKKYSSLRLVPAYDNFISERFDRCLDLYLCPRQRKMRMNVNPEDLIPKLPKPKDLQPFPSVQALIYHGHKDMVRCITVESSGQFLASGSDDCTIRIWEILTARCMKVIMLDGVVKTIAWCPDKSINLIAASVNNNLYLINPGVGDRLVLSNTDHRFKDKPIDAENTNKSISWKEANSNQFKNGIRIIISHPKEIKQITWEGRGVYFATVMSEAGSKSVVIHKLPAWTSQIPFQWNKGLVQCVQFHPLKPFFFIATQRYVRIYNLVKKEFSKKLLANCKWVSSLAIHPQGDNLIIGSYDSKLNWFDLDLSSKPYKSLRYHKKAIRKVAIHRNYPLFASASDDLSIIISHGMVYNDLLQDPLIVPVKQLKGHTSYNDLGVLDCCFHPIQPWIFSSGADKTIRLYT